MRPVRLELQGFGSFRDETVFDFEGIDFFALVGPTGNGKSTVIDAIGFALYGKVPRHDDRSAASSIVSLGAIEARVRLTFDVNDTRYVAVRTVKMRNDKPKQDVRLETASGELIAAQVREFAEQVETILGMPFEDFTRCVALPQGEFQKFLHEEPKQRRSVLVRLLNLGSYEELGRRARERATKLNDHIGFLEVQHAQLVDSIIDYPTLTERRGVLIQISNQVEAALPLDAQRSTEIAESAARIEHAKSAVVALGTVTIPEALAALAQGLTAEQTKLDAAQQHSEQLAIALADLEVSFENSQSVASIPVLEAAVKTSSQLAKLTTTLEQRTADLADLDRRFAIARVELENATDLRISAENALDQSRSLHRAHALREHLNDGDECPVCAQEIMHVPNTAIPPDFTIAQGAARSAVEVEQLAQRSSAAFDKERSAAASALDTMREQAARLHADLDSVAAIDDLERALRELRDLELNLKTARSAATESVSAERQARDRLHQLRHSTAELQTTFDRQRDHVSALHPPERIADDLLGSWLSLADWANKTAAAKRLEMDTESKVLATLLDDQTSCNSALRDRARAQDLDAPDLTRLASMLAAAVARCDAALETSAAQAEASRSLASDIASERSEQQVAELLGRLLRTDAFVNWLVEEALAALVNAASTTLYELSAGQYSLRHGTSSDFEIVDHANADATRSVRSLSGGETFQASLALALALSDQLADLAANGAARLEAIFLDEGFGTLDPESLDTVATTIERLGSSGRMVGIVTHVRDLAQRVPVRFEITKIGNRSQVEVVTS